MTQRTANAICGSKENFYRLVHDEGYYLPSFKCRAITNNYLQGILAGRYFRFYKNQIQIPPEIKKEWSKLDLLAFIQGRVGNADLGFGPEKMPDRAFLQNVVYTLDPTLEIFSGVRRQEPLVRLPATFLERLKFFDPDDKNLGNIAFKKTPEQKREEVRDKFQKRLRKKERRRQYMIQNENKLLSEIDMINDQLNNDNDI